MLSRLIKTGRQLLVAAFIGLNKVLPLGESALFRHDPLAEPQKQDDPWEDLMNRYTNGTEEEQEEAARILYAETPEAKRERDAIFLSRWSGANTYSPAFFPKKKGTTWAGAEPRVTLEQLRERSEENARYHAEKKRAVL